MRLCCKQQKKQHGTVSKPVPERLWYKNWGSTRRKAEDSVLLLLMSEMLAIQPH